APGFRGASGEASRDDLQAAWAPDSATLVFTATTGADAEAHDDAVTHLYQVALAGGEPRALTSGDVSHARPVFSADGHRLGCLTSAERGQIYAANRPAVGTWPWTGNLRNPAAGLDRSILSLAFSPDGSTLVLHGEEAGRVRLWTVPVDGGEAEAVSGPGGGAWISPSVPGRAPGLAVLATWEAAHRPAEVYRIEPGGGAPRPLTRFTAPVVETLDLPPLREFWCTNRAGRALHSYLALPPGFDPARRYPLLVLIHGGHASMWRDGWTRRWNCHLLARPGYVVLLTDYTGSTGYGEGFTRAIRGDPLRGPADDLNLAADEAIRRHPFIDGSRQAAAGASYGGHLANWLEATTTRYRCLISHAGLASLYSQWATSDSIHHRELMMGGPFWEKSAAWLDQSPATYARDFRTPMLLSIGESDHRVPLNNVLEMWSLLQRQRVPSRLLVWPEENHWIQKGENSRVFYREVHDWLARWLRD
ncbi:MAG: S9 family peptidase, partial [Verrucomicrobiota bacterium]